MWAVLNHQHLKGTISKIEVNVFTNIFKHHLVFSIKLINMFTNIFTFSALGSYLH